LKLSGYASRLALVVPQLFGVVVIVFVITHLIPGDPVTALVGDYPAPPDYIATLRHDLGLDQPVWIQFMDYAGHLIHGDLGYSFAYNAPVVSVIGERIGATLILAASAFVLGTFGGIVLGVLAAVRHLRATDHMVTVLALVGFSIPGFWLSQLLVLLFAVKLEWLPSLGMHGLHSEPTAFGEVLDLGRHLILPVLALSTGHLALMTRLVRSSMIETLHLDFVRTARAKGLAVVVVVFKHALRNALIPVIAAGGYSVGLLLSTSALVETVFGWPGMGRLLYDSLYKRDYPVLVGIFIVVSLAAILANLGADILQARVDPRSRA
jgi:peptide/nickel transport system permease protein